MSETSGLVERARTFAIKANEGFVRSSKAHEPYYFHCENVALLVAESGGSDEEIAAALLHDTVEMSLTTSLDIALQFGQRVAEIVAGLTDKPDIATLPTLERKKLQAQRVKEKDQSVKRVKLADQVSNIRSMSVDPPVKWNRQKCLDYIQGARLVAQECLGISEFLDREFQKAYIVSMQVYV
jgi:(p)ppGpp synthase/HD superfamily hydrolase